MITEDGRNKSPYQGVAYTNVFFLIVPWILFAIFYPVTLRYGKMDTEGTFYFSIFFSYFLCSIFEMICVICGISHDCFLAVLHRVGHFFSNLSLSLKLAFFEYKEEVKETGIAYWFYFITINFTLIMTIGSGLYLFAKYLKDLL